MTRYRWSRRCIFVSLAVLSLLLSGCGLGAKDTSTQIDPPQVDYELETVPMTEVIDEEVMAVPEKLAPVTLYFKDAQGYVAPVGLRIPAKEGIARYSLEFLVDGGPSDGLLPEGFSALIPKGTTIKGMDIRDGLAIVDFSEHFTQYNAQDERKILEAIAWTLTGYNTIDRVQLWVEGKPLKEMPVDQMPLDEPLTRGMGINLERAEGVNPALASPVTLYFQNQNSENYTYYVPVTRLIPYTDDLTLAAVNELVKGPAEHSQLSEVISSTTEILDVHLTNDVVTVNFGNNLIGLDNKIAAEALQAVVLSLTEQTGVPKVQIMIDGKSGIATSDNTNYSQPVTRPSQVNPLKL